VQRPPQLTNEGKQQHLQFTYMSKEQQNLLQLRNEGKRKHLRHLLLTYKGEQQHLQLTYKGDKQQIREIEAFVCNAQQWLLLTRIVISI
jgi:hypothetical protein